MLFVLKLLYIDAEKGEAERRGDLAVVFGAGDGGLGEISAVVIGAERGITWVMHMDVSSH